MKVSKTKLDGVVVIENFNVSDNRGMFTKIYQQNAFRDHNLCDDFKEIFFTTSRKDVIRGLHFQLPPHEHAKLVSVVKGEILDVVFDLRSQSKTYGMAISFFLSEHNHKSIYIPPGLAHGFKSISEDVIVIYNVSSTYDVDSDSGIRFDSIDFDWQLDSPIISERDKLLIKYEDFRKTNPF